MKYDSDTPFLIALVAILTIFAIIGAMINLQKATLQKAKYIECIEDHEPEKYICVIRY